MWISMLELESTLGKDMARVLCRTSGGINQYVPGRVDASHALAKTIGLRGMEILCAEFGGMWITVPNGKKAEPHKERVAELLQRGMTKKAVAEECGVTERYVYYVAEFGPRQEQLTLPL